MKCLKMETDKQCFTKMGVAMKVIISDDEPRVCQLVENLIDWSSLGMTVEAIVYNGTDAMDAIREHQPEIVITDIRMPGMDGLELIRDAKEIKPDIAFIIISGFRHFEYAQNAIKYGVEDYLLKPIKKDELYHTLKKIRSSFLERQETLSREESYHRLIQNNVDQLRAEFLDRCLEKNYLAQNSFTLDTWNQQYRYQFRPGTFQIMLIKLDGIDTRDEENLSYIQEKTLLVLRRFISDLCIESEFLYRNTVCIAVLNYRAGADAVREVRRAVKQGLKELLFQKDIFQNLSISIGLGVPVDTVGKLYLSRKTAMRAIEQRLIKGNNQVLEGECGEERSFAYTDIFADFNKQFSKALEWMDEREAREALRSLKQQMKSGQDITGHEILQMAKEALNLYCLSMRQYKMSIDGEESFFERTIETLDNMGSLEEIYDYLIRTIGESFHTAIELKKQDNVRPVRDGKQYIQQHYSEPISLEIVSRELGFNPTYFSSLFKKETGLTFLEYVTEVRMEMAKEFLRDTDWTVADICERVGYKDTKYFSKSFRKITGLKPNEYRKIYS